MLNGISRPIYVATEPVDMRKSFDGLSAIVKNHFHQNPLSGHLFVFINQSADRMKVLYFDDDGYALWVILPAMTYSEIAYHIRYGMTAKGIEKRTGGAYRAMRAAASDGGIGDFFQRSGKRFSSESNFGFQSLSR